MLQIGPQFGYYFFGILIQEHVQWGAQHFVAVEQVIQMDSHIAHQKCDFHFFDVDGVL